MSGEFKITQTQNKNIVQTPVIPNYNGRIKDTKQNKNNKHKLKAEVMDVMEQVDNFKYIGKIIENLRKNGCRNK